MYVPIFDCFVLSSANEVNVEWPNIPRGEAGLASGRDRLGHDDGGYTSNIGGYTSNTEGILLI